MNVTVMTVFIGAFETDANNREKNPSELKFGSRIQNITENSSINISLEDI